MSFIDFIADVIASPVTITAKVIETSINAVESLPDVAEKVIEKVEEAINKIGD